MSYKKKFKEWGEEKEKVNKYHDNHEFFPKVREIFYSKFGVNVGFEADGKTEFLRPVIVLAKIGSLYWVAPLTSKLKENYFHHTLKSVNFEGIDHSVVMLSQGRIIDKKRLIESMGLISKEEFIIIQKKMKSMYFPSSF